MITIIYPRDTTYSSRTRTFRVRVSESAAVVVSIDGDDNITMSHVGNLYYEVKEKLDYGKYTAEFYATDSAGNVGYAEVDFEIERESSGGSSNSRRKDDKDDKVVVNSLYDGVDDNDVPVRLGVVEEEKGSLGYWLLFLLALGIIVMMLICVLILKDR